MIFETHCTVCALLGLVECPRCGSIQELDVIRMAPGLCQCDLCGCVGPWRKSMEPPARSG